MQILFFLLFLIIMPLLTGYLLLDGKDRSGPYVLPGMWCTGFGVLFAAMYWPAVICILARRSLTDLTVCYVVILTALTAAGAAKMIRRRENPLHAVWMLLKGLTFPELLAFAAVFAHAAITALMMHVDDDDYAFVANATTSLDTNTLLRYIGGSGKELIRFSTDGIERLVSSPHFCFYAVIAKLSGTRPAALCHTYLPPVFTFLFFAAFLLIGYELFRGDRRKTGTFTLFIFLIAVSSYFSTRTAETFMMVRSWQGKAQVVGFVLPMLLGLYLKILREGRMTGRQIVLAAVFLEASCLMTSMGAMLAAGCVFFLSVITAALLGDRKVFLRSLPPLVLPLLTAVLYLYVK